MILFRHCCGGTHSREQLHGQGYKTDLIFMNACVFCISCNQLKVLNGGFEDLFIILKQSYMCHLKQFLDESLDKAFSWELSYKVL